LIKAAAPQFKPNVRGALKNALAAFMRELDGYTLADLIILKPTSSRRRKGCGSTIPA
jgi:hypothetical protein